MDRHYNEGVKGTRRWGTVISVFYAGVIMGLLLPGWGPLAEFDLDVFLSNYPEFIRNYPGVYTDPDIHMIWVTHIWTLMLIGGQVLLLFLSVDTSWQRRNPEGHSVLAITVTAMLAALLSFSVIWSLVVGFLGEEGFDYLLDITETISIGSADWLPTTGLVAWWMGLWAIWATVFCAYYETRSLHIEKVISWVLKGSILVLLIAVSAHVVILQNDNNGASPLATAFCIVTGLAIMLMCFGPRILSLHKSRVTGYQKPEH